MVLGCELIPSPRGLAIGAVRAPLQAATLSVNHRHQGRAAQRPVLDIAAATTHYHRRIEQYTSSPKRLSYSREVYRG